MTRTKRRVIWIVVIGALLFVIGRSVFLASPRSYNTPLTRAAATGDLPRVQQLLAGGAGVDQRDWRGRTALEAAAWHGKPDVVRLLLARGASHTDPRLLIGAVRWGNVAVVKLLLDAGADPNAKDRFSDSAVLHAAEFAHADMVELLASHGADVNARGLFGLTPLHRAARLGYLPVVKSLVAHGADVNAMVLRSTPLDEVPFGHTIRRDITDFLREHGGKHGYEIRRELRDAPQS